ncbi:MAG: alpha/beta hydrolase [Tunicatimonas sp.]
MQRVHKAKNLAYREANAASGTGVQHLNVYSPRRVDEPAPVLIFIHGGSWKSGKKELYYYLGKRLARKGVVAVVIDYPLSPDAQYNEMAHSAACAVRWTQQHVADYGGDPDRIFVSGHSAGGHLAALITVRDGYFDTLGVANPIRGAVLIDAAGLDMYGYLSEQAPEERKYQTAFTKDPATWKEASPLYHLHANLPPFLIYRGGKTYPSIAKSNDKFVEALKPYGISLDYRIQPGKKHIPMILQFMFSWNPRYREIVRFLQNPRVVRNVSEQ